MYSVGIVGAVGAVGSEIIDVLAKRNFPIRQLVLYSSGKSVEQQVYVENDFYGKIALELFTYETACTLDIVFIAVGNDFSNEWCKKLATDGVLVIDNSSAFRYDNTVPLVIPEININTTVGHKLIANPNCTTAIALMALYPIHKKYKLKKVIVSTYQAASGAGVAGVNELKDGMKCIVGNEPVSNKVFVHPLPYNIIPHIDAFMPNAYTKEEMKVVWEMKKILNDDTIKISCTAVRIPVLRAHSEAITIETEHEINASDVRELLRHSEGIDVSDDPTNNLYPMPLTASNKWNVEVGRIRENDVFGQHGLDLFVSGDQLLRGAALNAVLIAEQMCSTLTK